MTNAAPRTIACSVCLRPGVLRPGPGGRPDASCQHCGSLERHRALVAVLPALQESVGYGCLLDVAPSRHLNSRLRGMADEAGQAYVGMDFDPGADKRQVTLQASLTDVPLAEDAVGLMICFHVLEHIPDDAAAMAEMRRVLAPGGVAVVQVPWRPDSPTDEDPSASTEERLRRFGQADHVRWYGNDLEDRLQAAGLAVVRLHMGDLFDSWTMELLGITAEEPIWLCSSDHAYDTAAVTTGSVQAARAALRGTLERATADRDELIVQRDEARAQVRAVRGRLRKVRAARDEAVGREERLRRRPDVRLTSGVARRLRRLDPRSRAHGADQDAR